VFERELTLYEFTLALLKLIAADLDEAAMGTAPFEGANPPVWILGHLAICTDYAGQLLGLQPECPRPWHKHRVPTTVAQAVCARQPAVGAPAASAHEGRVAGSDRKRLPPRRRGSAKRVG